MRRPEPVAVLAAMRVLRERGLRLDEDVLEDIASDVVHAVDEARRRAIPVSSMQCGAPTQKGWPCQNARMMGNSGCPQHPHWRERTKG